MLLNIKVVSAPGQIIIRNYWNLGNIHFLKNGGNLNLGVIHGPADNIQEANNNGRGKIYFLCCKLIPGY